MLIAGRTVAGLGGSGLRTGALTIVSSSIPLEERPRESGPLLVGALTGFSTPGLT
jgi:MFS family permease